MKTIKKMMMAFIAISMVAVVSCKSDDDGGDGGAANSGTVSANVDGVSYESDALGTSIQVINAAGIETLTITSNEFSSSKNITIVVNGLDGEGTYEIGGGANISIVATYIEANASNPADTQIWGAPFSDTVAGEFNVSSFSDTTIQGTFSFTATNTQDNSVVEVTNGSFNLDY
ncbi:MAG: hypothetical protein ACI9Y7_002607 [Dokdonia sp.]|jgi:hypothetical protein